MSSSLTDSSLTDASRLSLRPARPSFLGLVRGEIFKVVRQWTPWLALLVTLGAVLLPFLLFFTLNGPHSSLKAVFSQSGYAYFYGRAPIGLGLLRVFGGVTIAIITARIIGQEYSLGTIRIVLARGVGRVQLLLAKLSAAILLALGLLLLGLIEILLLVVLQVEVTTGGLSALTGLPGSVWHDLGLYVLSVGISLLATILTAAALTVLFRNLAGGLSASLFWFPVDNFLTIMLALVYRLTDNDFWLNISAYLLGPNLNAMAGLLAHQGSSVWSLGMTPLVSIDSNHALLTTLIYSLIFFALALILTWKRDVKE